MNTISITGRLGAAPELKQTSSGVSVCSFSVAVHRPFSKDETDWIDCTAWRASADYLAKYGAKGSVVAVTGYLTVRKWTGKDGTPHRSAEIVSNTVEIIGSANTQPSPSKPRIDAPADFEKEVGTGVTLVDEEELPF